MTRKVTNKLLEMVDDGILDPKTVLTAALEYMSEDDVKDMAAANEFYDEDEDGDE